MEVNPLSIILVKSDSKGDRLLFRYPYETDVANDIHDPNNGKRNPYALNIIEDLLQTPMPQTSNIHKGQLTGFTDEVLSTLFAVKPELCHKKFELKVNDVRFVGHPTLFRANKDDGTSSTILINIVFALQALASHSVVKCYYDLSKRLGKALRYEEKRRAFLSEEMKIMITVHDELSSMDSDDEDNADTSLECCSIPDNPPRSAFHIILQKSSLANSLKIVFEELSNSGIIQVRINNWVLVSFCLPHKAHQFHNRGLVIEPETIDRCLRSLRPYHGMLLLVDPNELLETMPLDSSSSLIRLIMQYSPLKSLQTLAIEADLPLSQVFQLTGHLVYWAKATIIYPLCESNVYVIAPDAQVHLNSPLVEKFAQDFPGLCLIQVMSMLSLPAPLWYPSRTWAGGAALLARCVVWLLQRHLLLQLHTYIQFLPTALGPPINDYYCEKHNGQRQSLSDSMLSLNNIPNTSATTPSEKSSNESLNFKSRDSMEMIFPISSSHIGIRSSDISSDMSKRDDVSLQIKTSNRSPNMKNGISNPKSVFRENSLVCGDMTLESLTDSQPSSPQSLNSPVGCVQLLNISNNNNESKKDENSTKHMNGENQNWISDSLDSSHGLDNSNEVANMISNNNLKNTLMNHNLIKINDGDKKDPIVESATKIINGVSNIKTDDKEINLKLNLNLVQDKEKLSANNSNSSSGSNVSEKKYVSNYRHSDTNFQPPTVISNLTHYISCDVVDTSAKNCMVNNEPYNEETLLAEFTEEEKVALFNIPAAHNPDDLNLMATLYKKGYFRGEQHLEEIMYMENLTRSQVLQLLDKFRDVLITYETEDPAIAILYSNI
ncbi:GATOR complex protein Nprl3 isoform X2 [Arctopsyche grandis]|uniref:GATOR complex protein Nprl3 isoform X2 n=1 Tax=Arctopsyche grandis TaxID=121162 RepID=UPI00406D9661